MKASSKCAKIVKWISVCAGLHIRRLCYKHTLGYMGRHTYICSHVMIENPQNVFLGNNVTINNYVIIQAHGKAKVIIGNNVHVSYGTYILTAGLDVNRIDDGTHIFASINIQDSVWIGSRAVILPGITIGKSAVIAAGAIVTKDVPTGTLVAGVPARIVRQL